MVSFAGGSSGGGLRSLFGSVSGAGYSRTSDVSRFFDSSPAASTSRPVDMLGSLNGKNYGVNAQTSNFSTQSTGNVSGAQITTNQVGAGNVSQQVDRMKVSIQSDIQQAQRQVYAAMEESGIPMGTFASPAPLDVTDVMGSGMGAVLELVSADVLKRATPDQLAKLEDTLRAQASPTQAVLGYVQKQESTQPSAAMNWNAFFDNGHSLQRLMTLDRNNPDVPEMQALNQISGGLDRVEGGLQRNEDQLGFDVGVAMLNVAALGDVGGAVKFNPAQISTRDVANVLELTRKTPDPDAMKLFFPRDPLMSYTS
jgi:hypothetical protein